MTYKIFGAAFFILSGASALGVGIPMVLIGISGIVAGIALLAGF
jgi:hypothetical protein